jgi:hypothetical protein
MERRDDERREAADMQEANATGAGNNEQGRASFTTGSTTGGGSNFGQGSSHLGGESYRQGDRTTTGSNYANEIDRLGNSATGTANEGSSSPNAGADDSQGSSAAMGSGSSAASNSGGSGRSRSDEDDAPGAHERESTSLEQESGLDTSPPDNGRQQSGSWSRSSTSDE